MKLKLACILALTLSPLSLAASGANVKTGIGEKNGPLCAPGFYIDTQSQKCVAANWI